LVNYTQGQGIRISWITYASSSETITFTLTYFPDGANSGTEFSTLGSVSYEQGYFDATLPSYMPASGTYSVSVKINGEFFSSPSFKIVGTIWYVSSVNPVDLNGPAISIYKPLNGTVYQKGASLSVWWKYNPNTVPQVSGNDVIVLQLSYFPSGPLSGSPIKTLTTDYISTGVLSTQLPDDLTSGTYAITSIFKGSYFSSPSFVVTA
jgi:hypothetical protein